RTDPNIKNKQGHTALFIACNNHRYHHFQALEKIKTLLTQEKTDPNILNYKNTYSLLLEAIEYKEWEIVSLLINCPKIDFSVKDQEGKTILDFSLPENIQKLLPDD